MVFPVTEWIYIYRVAFNMKNSEHPLGNIFFLLNPAPGVPCQAPLHPLRAVCTSASPLQAHVEIHRHVSLSDRIHQFGLL